MRQNILQLLITIEDRKKFVLRAPYPQSVHSSLLLFIFTMTRKQANMFPEMPFLLA